MASVGLLATETICITLPWLLLGALLLAGVLIWVLMSGLLALKRGDL